jgi:hypothetical protein
MGGLMLATHRASGYLFGLACGDALWRSHTVGAALAEAARPYAAATLEEPLRHAFVAWSVSPDNDRAPGTTCLTATTSSR